MITCCKHLHHVSETDHCYVVSDVPLWEGEEDSLVTVVGEEAVLVLGRSMDWGVIALHIFHVVQSLLV